MKAGQGAFQKKERDGEDGLEGKLFGNMVFFCKNFFAILYASITLGTFFAESTSCGKQQRNVLLFDHYLPSLKLELLIIFITPFYFCCGCLCFISANFQDNFLLHPSVKLSRVYLSVRSECGRVPSAFPDAFHQPKT